MELVAYFAYGSNMLAQRLRARERAASARLLGSALLTAHRLSFDKIGDDGSGKCTIHPSASAAEAVHGVVFELPLSQLHALDAVEAGYERIEVSVQLAGAARGIRTATYRALPHLLEPGLRPFDWYHAFVLEGSRAAGHPEHYIERLSAQHTLRDPDSQRRQHNLSLLDATAAAKHP